MPEPCGFIKLGTQHLSDNSNIKLVQSDILQYHTDKKFDVVSMCGIGELFGGGVIIPIGRAYKETVKQQFNNFLDNV